MELFWKKYYPYGKYWKSASTKKIKREMDVTRGNYAKFWGVIYIFWGITMAGIAAFMLFLPFLH